LPQRRHGHNQEQFLKPMDHEQIGFDTNRLLKKRPISRAPVFS
jgi:hypothetical protein